MEQSFSKASPIKSALFVDFDNIYIGLSKTDPQAAERFASDPSRWLNWLERGLPNRDAGVDGAQRQRSILIRRCYPNPDAGFRRYRSFFTSAAFSVIDCPSMTRTGKNSADIYMVMDILDTLNHRTNFDEFIIFSGDSDFMPVLLRLRAHDKRTTTLAIDFMPPAYRASCDMVISEEEFIEDALGISNDGNCSGNGAGRARVSMNVLKEMAERVYHTVSDSGEVAGADLPDILKDFREFRESNNWLGFGTSQRLAEAIVCCEQRLQVVRINPMLYKLVVKPLPVFPMSTPRFAPSTPVDRPAKAEEKMFPVERAGVSQTERTANGGEKRGKAEMGRLRRQIVEVVKDLAASSHTAILLARASQYVVSKLGPQVLETQWAGAGSFKRLLQSTDDLGLEITTQPEPGYIFDPARHPHPAVSRGLEEPAPAGPDASHDDRAGSEDKGLPEPAVEIDYVEEDQELEEEGVIEEEEAFEEPLPSLEEFSRRVSQVTGTPDLTQRQYALIFHGIVQELQAIAAEQKVYNTYQSSKAVSDWCAEHGETISRGDIVMVFKGIIFQDGVRFNKRPGSFTALDLASVVCSNIKALCRRSRMELSDYEERLLEDWIMGELESDALEAAPATEQSIPAPDSTLADRQLDEDSSPVI